MATSTVHPTAPATTSSADRRRGDDRPTLAGSTSGGWLRRGTVLGLLAGTAVLYLWGLSASGYANSFYSAAVQAGSRSWKAFFYGSLDAGNSITVDKPPASLWLMALSVRIFGLSSWSILAPQALLGVATVGVLYASVKRTAGHWAGLVGGVLLALTPAAVLMFRFNNPDALLVFLLTLATYFTLRATEKASGRWLAAAGVLIGFGFLTKMLQAFLVLPAFALVYLIAAPTSVRKRVLHLLLAFATMSVSLSWWVATVELVPASLRPYIGGSQHNSVLELIFGYNGLGRIIGETGSATGGGGAAGSMWGSTGLTRLFDGVSGGMISWLIPAALLLGTFALIGLGRLPRSNPTRAAIIAWAGWLLVTGGVFSFMAGIYHDYYTVALAPAIAALVAVGGRVLWQRRTSWLGRVGLAAAMATTAAWGVVLINRASSPYDQLAWVIGVTGAAASLGLLFLHVLPKTVASVIVGLALVGGVTGPAAYSLNTATTPHEGSIVTAGPVSGGVGGGPGPGGIRGTRQGSTAQPGSLPRGGVRRGLGGASNAARVSAALSALLRADASSYTWVAAATGAQSAATYQLATGAPVMAIGGFNGSDPSPTLDQFKALVAQGKIHYYIAADDGGGNRRGGSSASSAIATWVEQTYTARTVGSSTIYDLSPTS